MSKYFPFSRQRLIKSAFPPWYDTEKYVYEVMTMKRELPKNVRQIGNVSDSSKIYVEDYVDTYLCQLCEKTDQTLRGAFLIGEIVQDGEEDYIYIYGAIQMQGLQLKGKDVALGEETWKDACETSKKYFGSAEILGWFLCGTGLVLEVNHNLQKVHQKIFAREKSILILKEAREKEEKYFVHKYKNLMESAGHYIYYEKNNEMQDYMIASRKKSGMTPSEVIEDTAIKNFRSIIRDKMEKKEKKENSRLVYAFSTFLVLIVVVMGVSSLNGYDRMRDLRNLLGRVTKDEEIVPVIGEVSSVGEPETQVQENEPVDKVEEQVQIQEETPKEEVVLTPQYDAGIYIVEKGDTLAIISRKMYGDLSHVDAICSMNGLEDGNIILVGQKLLLP